MKPEFEKLMQIGIIVEDLESTVKNYEKLGMGPWDMTVMSNEYPPFEDLTFDGQELPKGDILRIAMLQAYGMEIELIEPVAETAYKTWLEEHGPGIHHVAFVTKDSYEKVLEVSKEVTGKDPWVRGRGIGGKMDFSYLDLRKELGLIVECYGQVDPEKPGIDYDFREER